jgi:aminomethyltransferase
MSLIAVQGPLAGRLIAPLAEFDAESLGRFHVAITRVAGVACFVARTGYTGEDGFEILCAASDAPALWSALMDAGKAFGVEPIGLGARDVLRLEAAYPLHGHEITPETTPVAARLMWVVKPDKGDFIGRDAILRAKEKGEKRVLAGIEAIDRCIPRHACDVVKDGAVVGVITSGTFSPTLNKAIALAYINRECTKIGTEVSVVTGGRTCACRVVPTPFYKRP